MLNIAQRSAFLCFAIVVSVLRAKKKERKRAKNEKDGGHKKEARKKKSNFNQPCTDFIDCVVVKTSEKVIQYVGALLFSLFNCFVHGTRCALASVTWRILALRKQVRVYEDLTAGVLHSIESKDWTHSYYTCMYVNACVCVYLCMSIICATQIPLCELH